eukprot:g12684.t1
MISPGLIIFKKSDPHRLRFISSLSVKAAFEAREMVQLTLREDLRLKKLQTPAASPGTAPQVVQGDISGDSDSNIVQVIVDSGFAEVPRQLEFVLAPPSEQNFQEKASVQQALVLVEKQGEYGDAVGYVWNEVNKRKFENLITKTVDVFLESEAAAAEEEKKQEEAALAAAADAAQEVENGGTAGKSAYWPILEIAGFAVLADLLLLICCNDPATSYRRGSSSSSRDYFYLHGNTDRSSNVSTGLPSGSGSNRSGGNNNNNWRRGGVESSKGTTMVEASVQTSSSAEEQSEPSGRRGEPETVNPEQSRGSA